MERLGCEGTPQEEVWNWDMDSKGIKEWFPSMDEKGVLRHGLETDDHRKKDIFSDLRRDIMLRLSFLWY
ncbi:hypothetical protein OM33_12000 [Pseudoalteromonas piratica]|uniref:Uncharacterized protein n=1 Tax=Pseudoalteromonas piratica TaxID=1348114 RepID=A0A0A7EGG3_9GAMM|nr:hypothetical protein OM33_12000 [Pseudoalteromonas piratica]